MSTLYYDTLPPAETLPNTALISAPNYQRGLIVAPINIPMPNLSPPPALNQTTTGGACNCEQSSSSCNCPTPTPYKEPTPEERAEFQRIHDEYLTRQIQTHNKKYMYIAGGLIIAFFIFRKK